MRILRIKLRNYRGVAEREVRLEPSGVTVIQGPNEIGKSSLAEAVDLVFKHLDSSARAEVKAIKPVHADEGAEVEVDVVQAYAFTLFALPQRAATPRSAPASPEPHGPRSPRTDARSSKSHRPPLWDALHIQQGSGMKQADLKDQSRSPPRSTRRPEVPRPASAKSLSSRPRGGVRALLHGDGKPKRRSSRPKDVTAAQEELESIRRAVECIEADIAGARSRERDRPHEGEEARLKALAAEREADWRAVERRVGDLKGLESQRNGAQAVEKTAAAAVDVRAGLVAAVESARKAHASRPADIEAQAPARQVARAERDSASGERDEARQAHEAAAHLLDIRRKDYDFRRDELDMEQLRERKTRIDAAIQNAEAAEKLLVNTRMNEVLDIEEAHIASETAQTRLDTARTTVASRLSPTSPRGERNIRPREGRESLPSRGA